MYNDAHEICNVTVHKKLKKEYPNNKRFRDSLSFHKSRNNGKCHYPASVPSHLRNVEFRDGMD